MQMRVGQPMGQPDSSQPSWGAGRLLVMGGAILLLGVWILHLLGEDSLSKRMRPAAAPCAPTQPDVTGEIPDLVRFAASPSNYSAMTQDMALPDRVRIKIAVVDTAGDPVSGARVLLTDREIFGDLGGPVLDAQLQVATVEVDEQTPASGELALDVAPNSEYYVRVETKSGFRGMGPWRIKPQPQSADHFRYVAGDLFASAILLSDGKAPVYVDWALDWADPIVPPAVLRAHTELAEELALDRMQVVTAVLKSLPPEGRCRIAICHPEIGWFRSTADVVRAGALRTPTLVVVPSSGEEKPVKVTVRCVNPKGEEVSAQVRLMGGRYRPGSEAGWPRFGISFPSGRPQLFPPGQIEVGFVDASLFTFGLRRVDVFEDQTITLEVPFTPKILRLRLERAGAPFRGRPAVSIHIPSLQRNIVLRSNGSPDGIIKVSVPEEVESKIYVVADEWSAQLTVAPSPGRELQEIVVSLQ